MVLKYYHQCKVLCTQTLKKSFLACKSLEVFSRSVAAGLYIAFSPFPGAHMLMVIMTSRFFKLHFPTIFFAASCNNPWTMIPFYSGGYLFGHWLVHSILHWHTTWHIQLPSYFGNGDICLVSFLVGGNVLGISVALVSYYLLKFFAKHFITQNVITVTNNINCES